MQKHLRKFKGREGVLFIGIAQEKTTVPRTIRKRFGTGEGTIPWIDYTSAMVNFYYFYAVDEDFGPFFLKFCSYFPYTSKLCINGHEYLKRQLQRCGVDFEPLDNGLLSCADPQFAQRLAEKFDEKKIERFYRKWLARLPHPFPAADRKAGFRYQLSVLQSEFSLTQVWDRPRHGREFFEEVIRENIDLGRPENVQLKNLQTPATVDGQRASALRFGDSRVQALFGVLMLLCLQVEGFRNRQLCPLLAQMLGLPEAEIRPGRISYELRRLRLHGLIARIEKSRRYRLTREGLATVVFYQRTYARLIRPGLSTLQGGLPEHPKPLARAFQRLINEIDANISEYAA